MQPCAGGAEDAAVLTIPEAGLDVSIRLDGPVGDAPLLVFGHGAGAGIDHATTAGIAAALAERGFAVLRYQFPFMERQGGAGFGRDPLPVALATVAAAVAHGRSLAGSAPVFAGGHSYGGRMTTHAAAEGRLDGLSGLLLLSFPLHGARKPGTERAAHLAAVKQPMLFVSGERDAMAAAPLLEDCLAALPDAQLVRIPGADHGWKAPKRLWPEGPLPPVADAVAGWIDAHR